MSVNESTISNFEQKRTSFDRLLGLLGMVFAPALYLGSFFSADHFRGDNPDQIFASMLGVLYLCGAAASAIAMRRMRVTGTGAWAATLFYVQMTGLLLAMAWDVMEYATPHLRQSAIYFIADISYPFSHALMIVVGVTVWRAGVWKGWRLIPAFLCGLALPFFFLSSALVGRENSGWIFICGTLLGFLLLGRSVHSTELAPRI